ncbi:MAG: DMT family transporter [Lentilitoribacter sp.]
MNNNTKAIAFMVVSMFAFAATDTLIKLVSGAVTPAQTIFFLTTGGFIVFASLATYQGDSIWNKRAISKVLIIRYIAEIIGLISMVLALSLIDLSTIGAIIQSVPLLVTFGAVLWLGERVSWRRWTSIIIGFIGVLMIIQPGAEAFEPTVLLAFIAAIALSVRDLTTRVTPPDMSSASLACYTMMATIPVPIIWMMINGESFIPPNEHLFTLIGMVMLGAFGYFLIIASVRSAEVSVVSPYRYSRLVFLMGFGVLLFDEKPGFWVLLGAALIVASGLYMMWRERVVKGH